MCAATTLSSARPWMSSSGRSQVGCVGEQRRPLVGLGRLVGHPEVALGVEGVVERPVGDRRARDRGVEDVRPAQHGHARPGSRRTTSRGSPPACRSRSGSLAATSCSAVTWSSSVTAAMSSRDRAVPRPVLGCRCRGRRRPRRRSPGRPTTAAPATCRGPRPPPGGADRRRGPAAPAATYPATWSRGSSRPTRRSCSPTVRSVHVGGERGLLGVRRHRARLGAVAADRDDGARPIEAPGRHDLRAAGQQTGVEAARLGQPAHREVGCDQPEVRLDRVVGRRTPGRRARRRTRRAVTWTSGGVTATPVHRDAGAGRRSSRVPTSRPSGSRAGTPPTTSSQTSSCSLVPAPTSRRRPGRRRARPRPAGRGTSRAAARPDRDQCASTR